ncbi:MutH/Sau3AI family endonuclease [Bacillus cereus]|uniref:MutH/Sau3AI family endonuclease n=1 Tax=Bacillus cereus TaxID=1396 RepID=UPI00240741D2|nr:MutH/Sau3AI family endonuclease [Bacillus cereus]MDF9527324.1 MutH/Sau3AI family endonuclease [Bacillus cereus]MDG1575640.1 MutH/Sau3AI family endonuclease [Bacillus cereus]
MALHKFTRKELNIILSNAVGKTLGECDVNNVFAKTINSPKITGIAGDVVEQSILGYPPDTDKQPDLIVDGIETELKTTGIRRPKKNSRTNKTSNIIYEAKEPMSITAVSPELITDEEFETSSFWHKLEHLLLVYYHYDSPETVPAAEYAKFFIEGYHFHDFSDEDKEILKNDWLIVRDFIQHLKDTYEDPTAEYPRISSELRKSLMLIDTAPKWPNRPRFRLKRSTVSTLVQNHFGAKLEKLDNTYLTFKELDGKLHNLTQKYKNKTVRELMKEFDILPTKSGSVTKSISEQIIVKMFGGTVKKLSKIELFSKIGIVPKSIVQTTEGLRTEDMKFCQIDFEEWTDKKVQFDKSFVYNYFHEKQFLFIVFEEPALKAPLLDNKFLGFKRLSIDDAIIENAIKPVWEQIRYLINNNKLKETIDLDKNNKPIINKRSNTIKKSINFPKSTDNTFFIRGTGGDASKKPIVINGINMYYQQLWLRGDVVVSMLKNIDFI